MATTVANKLARLQRILKRQDPPGWGSEYVPSILATPAEAPSTSRPSKVFSTLLKRDCHVLSLPEQSALLLALHHPAIFELHEQRMLASEPRPHPLSGHPLALGMAFPPVRGTVAVADRLGVFEHHGWVYIDDPDQPGRRLPVPMPFIGDLLLFLQGDDRPYCINWTVKDTEQDFEEPHWNGKVVRNPTKAKDKESVRHALEDAYYRDADIRTVRITADMFDRMLAGNLRRAFVWTPRQVDLHEEDRQELIERLRASVIQQVPPLDIFTAVHRRIPCSIETKKAVLFQAVWKRELRVDLWNAPITVDRPLGEEREDVLARFQHLFSKEAP